MWLKPKISTYLWLTSYTTKCQCRKVKFLQTEVKLEYHHTWVVKVKNLHFYKFLWTQADDVPLFLHWKKRGSLFFKHHLTAAALTDPLAIRLGVWVEEGSGWMGALGSIEDIGQRRRKSHEEETQKDAARERAKEIKQGWHGVVSAQCSDFMIWFYNLNTNSRKLQFLRSLSSVAHLVGQSVTLIQS